MIWYNKIEALLLPVGFHYLFHVFLLVQGVQFFSDKGDLFIKRPFIRFDS